MMSYIQYRAVGFVLLLLGAAATMADSDKGRVLYQHNCTQCHEPEEGDWRSRQSRDFSLYVMQASRRVIKQRIKDGGRLCPSYLVLLSEEEIDNVVDYIKVLH